MGKFFVWCTQLANDVATLTARDEETAARLYAEKSYNDEPFDDQSMEIIVESANGGQVKFWVTPMKSLTFHVEREEEESITAQEIDGRHEVAPDDEAPAWSAEVFRRAKISRGDEVIREATGTLTKSDEPSDGAKAVAYMDAHLTAVELGYPSLTEALENLERLQDAVEAFFTEHDSATKTLIAMGGPGTRLNDSPAQSTLRRVYAALKKDDDQ